MPDFSAYSDFGIDFLSLKEKDNDLNIDFIRSTGDGKVDFLARNGLVSARVNSESGFTAIYPLEKVYTPRKITAVMMDLDGTTVKSEAFWISIIEKTVRKLSGKADLNFGDEDLPFVSGHSVSEHLQYCIDKFCPDEKLEKARLIYFDITHEEMSAILSGKESASAFTPAEGVKDFLYFLKDKGIKIGLVTSGLYEKAYPEILSAFKVMKISEKPEDFYDSFITAGSRLEKGGCGTLGELEAKPHPWLYSETFNVGLNIPFSQRNEIIGIEDSGAGVCSVRLSNVYTIGISGGNIISSGTRALCNSYFDSFSQIKEFVSQYIGTSQ